MLNHNISNGAVAVLAAGDRDSLSPSPFHGPRCIAGRLRRRGAMLRETPPSPPARGEGRRGG